jgi:selenide,water dikinase
VKRLVLVGGGHAHVEVLRRFGRSPIPDVEITLISPGRHTVYSGMLPGLVAGHYGWRACHIDLEVLSRFAGAHFLRDIAIGLDLERKTVHCADSVEVPYDVVSLDVGSMPDTYPFGESVRLGLPVKPVDRFLAAWDGVIQEAGERDLNIAIVGAGAGGIELCLAMQYRLRQRAPHRAARFTLLTLTDAILPDHGSGVRERAERVLRVRDVAVRTRSLVVGADERELLLDGGDRVPADRFVWVTGPAAPRWLGDGGLRTDSAGFMLIDDCARRFLTPGVRRGDVATMVSQARPKSGVYAVRQGPPPSGEPEPGAARSAAAGIQAPADGAAADQLREIVMPSHPGVGYPAEGAWVWRWKDWIDRRFMARYRVADKPRPPLRAHKA